MILWQGTSPHRGQARIWNRRKEMLTGTLRSVFAPCGPRWGKDVVCRETALWLGFSLAAERGSAPSFLQPPVMQWVVGPTAHMTDKLFQEYEARTRDLPRRKWETYPKRLELPGGYRIEFMSADKPEALLAVGLDILHITEAAEIKDKAWHEYLQQRLVSPGRLGFAFINGTPGTHPPEWYINLWRQAEQDPSILFVNEPSWENEFLNDEQRSEIQAHRRGETGMSELRFRTTYGAELVPEAGGVFRHVRSRSTGKPYTPDWGVYFYDRAGEGIHSNHNAVSGFTYGIPPDSVPVLDQPRRELSLEELREGTRDEGPRRPKLRQCYADRWQNASWGVCLSRLGRLPGRGVLYVDTSGDIHDSAILDPIRKRVGDRFQVRGYIFRQANKESITENFSWMMERDLVELLDPEKCEGETRAAVEAQIRELTEWRAKKLASGNLQYGGAEGGNDDMAIACITSAYEAREVPGGEDARRAFEALGGVF